jgi:hypothetical protein
MNDNIFSNIIFMIGFIALALSVLIFSIYLLPIAVVAGGGWLWWLSDEQKENRARQRTYALYEQAVAFSQGTDNFDLGDAIDRAVRTDIDPNARNLILAVGETLCEREELSIDIPKPPMVCYGIEGARYRDKIAELTKNPDRSAPARCAARLIGKSLEEFADFVPKTDGGFSVPITALITDVPTAVQNVMFPFFEDAEYEIFTELREKLEYNLAENDHVPPTEYKGEDVIDAYLGGTPLAFLFQITSGIEIPERLRYEHMWVLGGTGAGKTTALKRFIAEDIPHIITGNQSAVVIDSKGSLVHDLAKLDIPKERVVLIDAEDVGFPISLNLFAGQDRFNDYDQLHQEQLRNSIIELYEFVLSSIMSIELSGQQSVLFRYLITLLLEVPGATFKTFIDVLEEPDGAPHFRKYIDELPEIPRRFFDSQYDDRGFKEQRAAVLRRMYILLEIPAFERMFRNPESKLDIFTEMNAGKLILVNTSRGTMKEEGMKAFGRFFIAMIAQAIAERSTIHHSKRTPTFVYIDEAFEYIDKNISTILAQAREMKVGLIMAHQNRGQITDRSILSTMDANTSIKLAASLSAVDAAAMARNMNCDAEELKERRQFVFMTFISGFTKRAIPVEYPPNVIEEFPQRENLDELKAYTRETYASHSDGDADKLHDDADEHDDAHEDVNDHADEHEEEPTFASFYDTEPEAEPKRKRRKPRKSKRKKVETDEEPTEWPE